MHQEEQNSLKGFSYYFIKSLTFYDIKNDLLVKISFIINLLCIFAAFEIPPGLINWQVYSLYFMLFCITCLSSSLYLFAVIKELRAKQYTTKSTFLRIKRKSGTLIFSSFIYICACIVGILLFLLPGIFIVSIFFMHSCYIIDLGESSEDSYEACKRMTKRYREILFKYFLLLVLILAAAIYMFLTMIAASGSVLIVTFALSFIVSIAILIYERFVAYLYYDIEYKLAQNNRA